MFKRLANFLNYNKIFYSLQFAICKIRYTTNGNFAYAVFVNLQKAFDTVDQSILLSKMKHYGIRGVALSWFGSYLS